MNILITGATGFLGKALTNQLRQRGNVLTVLGSKNCDLTQEGSLNQFKDQHYDLIYHLAAWTQAGDFCLHHPGEQWVINQKINTHVLSWWHEHQKQAKLVCMGTSCSYDPNLPLKEENYLAGRPIESLFTYAMTKRMLYTGLLSLNKQFGLNYLHIVPSTLYGPDYHEDGRQMHFIFDLIRKIIRGKLLGEPVVLWGDGVQSREIVYLSDFVEILLTLAERSKNETINIGAGEEFTIRYFADLICRHVGYDSKKIQFDKTKYIGAKSKCLDTTKLKRLIPNLQLIPMEKGLSKTIDWFLTRKELFVS
ncbi:MAG: NAD-dependent epimerase/dehydratase family protein [Deltaproteobacteria bacterium]|nr:NAD-dependent epimerase/dehydratase family protein [Deltaproteobacteria bacterium]